jgi:hypothetical protein
MHLSTALLAAAAFTGLASAVEFTNSVFNNVTAGESFTFTWTDASGPVTITLKNGPRDDLQDVQVVTSGETGESFTWQVPASLEADTYAFEIEDSEGVPNYSIQFELIGGAEPSASASADSSAVATSTVEVVNSTTTSMSVLTTTTGASNLTTTRSATRTPSGSATQSGSESEASETSAPESDGMAAGLTSPLAFVFLAVGALMVLN